MINVAVFGTGAVARIHIDGYLSFFDRCRIKALCDIFPDKAEGLAKEKGLQEVLIFNDYRKALELEDIDLVSICLPPSVHSEVSISSLSAGKHVLVEKPMASSLEECDAMLVSKELSGKKLAVVSQNRFQTSMMRMKRLLDLRAAGKILHTTVNSYWWRGENYYDLWWRGTWEKEGGGCTLNHAVHHVDLLRWMLGMPEEVSAFFTNLHHSNSETEDFSATLLKYHDGSVAQLNASLVHHGEEQEMIFQCEKARISVPWKVVASTAKENGFPQDDPETVETLQQLYDSIPPCVNRGHTAQIEEMLNCLELGSEPSVTGYDGREALELILGIYKAASSRSIVSFPLKKSDPFYRKDTMIPLMPHFHKKTRTRDNFSPSKITLGRDMEKL